LIKDPKLFLVELFKEAVAAADPKILIAKYLPVKPKGRTIVVGVGKASGSMALAFENEWERAGYGKLEGLVVTSKGNERELKYINTIIAAHPVPDENSSIAAKQMLKMVSGLSKDDLVVALISGGGSSLFSLPASGISASDKKAVNKALLAGGVSISEMNCIRKHLSKIKGGRLAKAAYPAKLLSLVISDVPGDDAALVASGPTIADNTTRLDALEIVEKYKLDLPKSVMDWLNDEQSVAPFPSDKQFENNEVHLIANANMSLQAAKEFAQKRGIKAHIISDAIEGEASIIGREHGELACQIAAGKHELKKSILLLSGGETTVTLRHKGKGGRNSEFLLSLALTIDGVKNIYALAADTDGIDGSEKNAGAYCDATSIERMKERSIDGANLLQNNDAYSAFSVVSDLIFTGVTATNVNDFRAVLIQEE